MKIASFVSVVLLVAACSSGSGSGSVLVYCAKSDWSCRCLSKDFTLEPWETAVANCDSVPENTVCLHDLDAAGNSTRCECTAFVCTYKVGDPCRCDFRSYTAEYTIVAGCNDSGGGVCCEDAVGDCACTTTCLYTNGSKVSACPTAPSSTQTQNAQTSGMSTGTGGTPATSCAGLHWTAP